MKISPIAAALVLAACAPPPSVNAFRDDPVAQCASFITQRCIDIARCNSKEPPALTMAHCMDAAGEACAVNETLLSMPALLQCQAAEMAVTCDGGSTFRDRQEAQLCANQFIAWGAEMSRNEKADFVAKLQKFSAEGGTESICMHLDMDDGADQKADIAELADMVSSTVVHR